MATTVRYEEWLLMPEVQDATEEVIDGEIIITPPAKWIHALAVERLSRALRSRFDEPEFFIATAQFGLVICKDPLTVRCPDLAIFAKDTIVEKHGFVHSPPRLVAEVLAPGEDLTRKLKDYADLGVPEIWIVSPETRIAEVLRFENQILVAREDPPKDALAILLEESLIIEDLASGERRPPSGPTNDGVK
jgi:Uma2 family endonuclease